MGSSGTKKDQWMLAEQLELIFLFTVIRWVHENFTSEKTIWSALIWKKMYQVSFLNCNLNIWFLMYSMQTMQTMQKIKIKKNPFLLPLNHCVIKSYFFSLLKTCTFFSTFKVCQSGVFFLFSKEKEIST